MGVSFTTQVNYTTSFKNVSPICKNNFFLRNAQKPTVFSTILSEPWGFCRFELRTARRRFVNKRRRGDLCAWVLSPQGAWRYSLGGGRDRETGEYGLNFV